MNNGHILKDISASIVVFLVALPLSLGIAVASGAPVEAGLFSAIIGGIVVGVFGGAPLQVSGPAAGLTVMVFGYVNHFGYASLGVIVLLAGLIQIVMGYLKIAKSALMISPAVLHAMLAGIGILITLSQVHVILGFTPLSNAWLNIQALPSHILALHYNSILVAIVTLVVLISWNRWVSKKISFVPGSLIAILSGTLVSLALPGEISRVMIKDTLFSSLSFPSIGGHHLLDFLKAAIALAIVASSESLLCAVATDQLHGGKRADLDKELLAQGVGNTVAGLVGGLPITGVIVRSSANISAGAKSKLAAIFHGIWILVFVLIGSRILKVLPLSALAALLVFVGIDLVKIKEIKKI